MANGSVVCAASKHANSRQFSSGVVFEPFEEVKKKELKLVPTVPQDSLARHKYSNDSESLLNQQIKFVFSFLSIIGSFIYRR